MTISRKLWLVIAFIGIVLSLGGYLSYHSVLRMQTDLNHVENVLEPLHAKASEIRVNVKQLEYEVTHYASDPRNRDTTRFSAAQATFTQNVDDFLTTLSSVHPIAEADSETVDLENNLVEISQEVLNNADQRRQEFLEFRRHFEETDNELASQIKRGPQQSLDSYAAHLLLRMTLHEVIMRVEEIGLEVSSHTGLASSRQEFLRVLSQLPQPGISEIEEQKLDKIRSGFESTLQSGREFIALSNELKVSLEEFGAASARMERHLAMSALPKIGRALLGASDDVLASGRTTLLVIWIGTLITIIITSIAVFLLLRNLRHSVEDLKRGAARIGAGDLDYRIPIRSKDGLGNLADAFNTMAGERKQAELRIGRQEALLAQSRDAAILMAFDGVIAAWYKGAENLFGWRSEEVLGQNIRSIWTLEEEFSLGEIFEHVRNTGEWTGCLTQIREDGNEIIVQSSWTRVSGPLTGDSVLVICSDVTEFKKLEQQFLRSQRMESLGTLAGGIAHDLNNVLGPIFIASDLLGEREDDPDSLMLLKTIDDSARRGRAIVKQVLSFSDGAESEVAPIQIRHIVKESVRFSRETFPRSIKFISEIDKDMPLVKGDGTQLHQVIMNLLVNARDAMTSGGEIRISVKHEKMSDADSMEIRSELKGGEFVHLSVRDTGEGIPPVMLDRIFEPFFTTKVRERGTGLGLSTSKAIVESHNGAIVCHSELGHGSRFDVYLPAIVDPLVPHPEEVKEFFLPTLPGKWVLIVDDEPAILKTLKALLESKNLHVAAAKDGAEALSLFVKHTDQFDLVVTDMAMPIMDGAATIRAVRKLDSSIPIIAMSGLLEFDLEQTFADDENIRYIPKPFRSSELLGMISELLDEKVEFVESPIS